jgi:hypothetical protein
MKMDQRKKEEKVRKAAQDQHEKGDKTGEHHEGEDKIGNASP